MNLARIVGSQGVNRPLRNRLIDAMGKRFGEDEAALPVFSETKERTEAEKVLEKLFVSLCQ